jgi:hypothetical protein
MSAAVIASNSPSPFYRQHHAVEAPRVDEHEFRLGWRRRTRLDVLLAAGAINGREYRRAVAFRSLCEAAYSGATARSNWHKVFVDRGCRSPAPELTERQAAALARLAEIRAVLGALYPLLVLVVIDDASWCEIGQHFDVDPRTARRWAAASIAALAAV